MREIEEPELTALIVECGDRGVCPTTVIRFVGERAILIEDEELTLWEGEP